MESNLTTMILHSTRGNVALLSPKDQQQRLDELHTILRVISFAYAKYIDDERNNMNCLTRVNLNLTPSDFTWSALKVLQTNDFYLKNLRNLE